MNINEIELETVLNLHYGKVEKILLDSVLSKPLTDIMLRGSKRIRGRLIQQGYLLASSDTSTSGEKIFQIEKLASAIEKLHAGSLIIDDIEDCSGMRRGQPSLHIKYGLSIALNAGNYLYFLPTEVIRSLNLPPLKELALYHEYHQALRRAHIGQALDVGLPIDTLPQDQVSEVCLASMELKSGALFSLAMAMGAHLADPDPSDLEKINHLGHGLGIGLQMFDDLGNIKGMNEPSRQWEDLIMRRPTWIWACAAKYFSENTYQDFVSAVHQLTSDRHPIQTWLGQHNFIYKAKNLAFQHLENCFVECESSFSGKRNAIEALQQLRSMAHEISRAYD